MILVISSKNSYAAKRLIQEAGAINEKLKVMSTADLIACNFKPKFKFNVLYIRDPYLDGSPKHLPEIIKFAKNAAKQGVRVVDSNIVKGKIGEGKWKDYEKLKKAGLPIPNTVTASVVKIFKTSDLSDVALAKLEAIYLTKKIAASPDKALAPRNHMRLPLILKWTYGMGGKNAYLINSQISNIKFQKILALHPEKEWMFQEYIEADYEYKVICVGYKALPVILKIKFNKKAGRPDFGHFDIIRIPTTPSRSASHPSLKKEGRTAYASFSPPVKEECPPQAREVVKLAESASRLLGRELSKVDILEKDGKFYILEVNRFPGLLGFEKFTGYNVVKDFVAYLLVK